MPDLRSLSRTTRLGHPEVVEFAGFRPFGGLAVLSLSKDFHRNDKKIERTWRSYLLGGNSNDKSGPFTRMTGCPYISSMCLDKLI